MRGGLRHLASSFRTMGTGPPPRLRRALVVSAAFAAAALVAATAYRIHLDRFLGNAVDRLNGLRQRLMIEPSTPAARSDHRPPDFTATLPEQAPVERLVRLLQQESTERGVSLLSVTAALRDGTGQTLGRSEVSVVLRGAYPRVKAVLAEAVERTPGAALLRMSLRRSTAASEVEGQAVLVLFTRPVAVPGG